MSTNVREVKLVLLGEAGVGKSSLVLRFVANHFKAYSESTIGAAFMSKTLVVDDQAIKFQIWDTAGQEKYHSLAPMYYRGASAAIVVYDITRATSFKTLQNWVTELRSLGPENIVIAIAGNKCDLDDKREVDKTTAGDYAEEINAIFVETSAKTGNNVQEMFTNISKKLPASVEPKIPNVDFTNGGSQKKGCC